MRNAKVGGKVSPQSICNNGYHVWNTATSAYVIRSPIFCHHASLIPLHLRPSLHQSWVIDRRSVEAYVCAESKERTKFPSQSPRDNFRSSLEPAQSQPGCFPNRRSVVSNFFNVASEY